MFGRYLLVRMGHDRVNVNAGYLAYITLLSIVPMLTVLLSILSSFSIFENVGDVVQDYVITHFVPAAGDAVRNALTEFRHQYRQNDRSGWYVPVCRSADADFEYR